MREFAYEFYHSPAWLRCRAAYIAQRIAIDGGICEVCHQELGYIVHHKVWLTPENIGDVDVTLNFDNLRYECLDCHNREVPPGEREPFTPRLMFDVNGDPIPPH